ncbi:hypothetical protein SDC9_194374 [bioreactor metagenome]|uniref:Uncharacterized protein n=1 Tax=bioreactor metagenome TaxID=1076179 RepID=A0A645I7A0_9ZZZZ
MFVNVAVCHVGQRHDFTNSFTKFTAFPCFADHCCGVGEGFIQRRVGQLSRQNAVKTLSNKACITGCQVDYFVDDIGINALDKVLQVQVDVINT